MKKFFKRKGNGIPEKFVNAIGLMREGTLARVIRPDSETNFFNIMAGVLQGDILASYLFAIVLDYALRIAIGGKEKEIGLKLDRRKSRRYEPVILTDTDFVIAIMSEEMDRAQNIWRNIELEENKNSEC